ncbi:hydroxyacid dehydrogenase [Leifsonia sp. 2MCAF36]|uniref:hydroxyacid dehydrogenase n=1 Tax=Leifsonia sp. 2MCAF36 TaxID=3232988 RepID=UPI003F9D99E3
MTRVLLAVHPRVRRLVLAPGALHVAKGIQLVDLETAPWESGWAADAEADVVVTGWGTPAIDEAALDGMPSLRAILHIGGSIREVVDADVWSRGVTVVTAAEVNNEAVADFVAAQFLLAVKGAHSAARTMCETGILPGPGAAAGSYRQSVGLVSYGSVARKVRQRVRRYEARVLAWDPFVDDDVFSAEEVERVAALEALFERSRVVSVHAPLIPGETENLIGSDLLERLPQGAAFINTARGALVDETALADVLARRGDLLAVLDVTWPEPPAADSPLYTLPNVILTGHTAGSVGSENLRLGESIARALASIADGRVPDHAVGRAQALLRA